MEKGLFSSLFILIMLIVISPQLHLIEKNNHLLDTKENLNQLVISADQIIVDALVDKTISNGCAVSDVAGYNAVIKNYLDQFLSDLENINSIKCSYSNLNSNMFFGGAFSGTIDISCLSENELSSIDVKKQFKFSKKINVSGACNVKIKDIYDSDHVQADVTR